MPYFYKMVKPDGLDFFSSMVDYREALETGRVLTHPSLDFNPADHSTVISVGVFPTETTYLGRWPWALFKVESIGEVKRPLRPYMPFTAGLKALKVIEELDPLKALGPHALEVLNIWRIARTIKGAVRRELELRYKRLNQEERSAATFSIRRTAMRLGRQGALHGAWAMVPFRPEADAATVTVVRDLVASEHYEFLAGPWNNFLDDLKTGRWIP